MSPLAIQLTTALLPAANGFDGHHDWGGGWWILMVVAMVAFWALVIGGVIWLARELSRRRPPRETGDGPAALGILDRRLAEGAISVEEYTERRRALLEAEDRDRG